MKNPALPLRRRLSAFLAVSGFVLATAPALAGEQVLFGPAPDWVAPAEGLTADRLAAPGVALPLHDAQTLIEGDRVVAFTDRAVAVASAEMLNRAGNLGFQWQPAHGDLTVHAVQILRGGQTIDVLKDGSGLSVLRREERLEQQVLDGSLTAYLMVEGLRVGDVLRWSWSVSMRDPVLAGRAQAVQMLIAQPTKLLYGRSRLVWPEGREIGWKALMPGITAVPRKVSGGRRELVIGLPAPKLPEVPQGTPARFQPLPAVEASTFRDWAEVSAVMAPLYRTQGAIAEGSDLARLVDGIASRHADPQARLAEALRVVQSDVRYQLVTLGTGNYEPQKPEETWAKRFGDCKAKTLLLLAMLHRLGITAEAAMASSTLGDMVPQRLPAPLAFDHVFVRAEIGGESFWLDGTSLGARAADLRDVPRFGWVLPVRDKGAELVRLPLRADARAAIDLDIAYDASASIHLPMPYRLQLRFTGPQAERMQGAATANADVVREFAERYARSITGNAAIGRPEATWDPVDGSWTLRVEGIGGPDFAFRDGRWRARLEPMLKIGFDPDRSRASWRNLPALVPEQGTASVRWSLKLPERAAGYTLTGADPLRTDLPWFAYARDTRAEGLTVSDAETKRVTGVEVPPEDIGAARKASADAAAKVAELALPASYPLRWQDAETAAGSPALARVRAILDGRIADDPDDAARLSDRAWFAMRLFDWAGAEADYTKALALDPAIGRYLDRARLRGQRGNFAGALKDAQAAFDLDADNEAARRMLADLLSENGKVDEALALLDPDPDPAEDAGEDTIGTRAEILSRAGRTAEVVSLLDDALARRASSASLLNARCWFKALAGVELDAALGDCTRAIELASDPAAYYDSRAMVHFRAGRLVEARTDLDAALAIAPELAPTRFMRGLVLGKLGDKAGSAQELAAARRMSPTVDRFFARYGIRP